MQKKYKALIMALKGLYAELQVTFYQVHLTYYFRISKSFVKKWETQDKIAKKNVEND